MVLGAGCIGVAFFLFCFDVAVVVVVVVVGIIEQGLSMD